jgi:hypothetical protein
MPAHEENTAVAQPTSSPARGKLLRLLRTRLRQLVRATAVFTVCLAAAAAAFAVWWMTSLNGLPDIGDPFDVAAFRSFHIPDDENAFTFFNRAQQKLTNEPQSPRSARVARVPTDWRTAGPKLREWVAANRQALGLFLEGAGKADGIARPPGQWYSVRYNFFDAISLIRLALLEAGKRQESGDMAGAWECYRAILRTTTHTRRHGSLMERYYANVQHDDLRSELATWTADARTTIPQLRRALDEAIASEPSAQWDAFSLKVEYLDLMRQLEEPVDIVHRGLGENPDYGIGDLRVPVDVGIYIFAAHRLVLREPERSKRVARLLAANWLAHVETPAPGSRTPALRVPFPPGIPRTRLPLFSVRADAPAPARALSPQDLASWLGATRDLVWAFRDWDWWAIRLKEKSGHADLVISLAQELHRRERGSPAPSERALVGTYLEHVPDDGSDELDDGTKPARSDR